MFSVFSYKFKSLTVFIKEEKSAMLTVLVQKIWKYLQAVLENASQTSKHVQAWKQLTVYFLHLGNLDI